MDVCYVLYVFSLYFYALSKINKHYCISNFIIFQTSKLCALLSAKRQFDYLLEFHKILLNFKHFTLYKAETGSFNIFLSKHRQVKSLVSTQPGSAYLKIPGYCIC